MKPDKPVARRGDYEFDRCEGRVARPLVEAHHYAKGSSHRAFAFCLKREGRVVGAAMFLPPLPPVTRKYAKDDPKKVVSLHRLVVAPGEPQNAAGMLISRSLRQLRKDGRYNVVVTYADTKEGHTGTVYRATNAQYVGSSGPRKFWVDPKTGRQVAQKATKQRTTAEMRALGYEQRLSPGKHIYKWVLV